MNVLLRKAIQHFTNLYDFKFRAGYFPVPQGLGLAPLPAPRNYPPNSRERAWLMHHRRRALWWLFRQAGLDHDTTLRFYTTYGQPPSYMPTVAIDNVTLLTQHQLRRCVQLDYCRGQYMLRWERYWCQSVADRRGRDLASGNLDLPPDLGARCG